MGLVFFNRLSGETAVMIEGRPLLGQWQIRLQENERIVLNSVPVTRNDFLVPDLGHQWKAIPSSQERTVGGSFEQHQLLPPFTSDSICAIGQRLEQLCRAGASWTDWTQVTPITPDLSERLKIQPLDALIREHLGNVGQVFHSPRMHLKLDAERVHLSQAKRIPSKASDYLVAHTEDWETRTLRSVHPKRILSLLNEEELDIYENRLAARLIDRLRDHLRRRIRDIENLNKTLRQIDELFEAYLQRGSDHTYWRRADRFYRLWGEAQDPSKQQLEADETLAQLKRMEHTLLGFRSTALYKEIPPRADVTTLKMTNILSNDYRYHSVAILWKECRPKSQDPNQVYQRYQSLCRSFDAFCALLICHALNQLGFAPARGAQFFHGSPPLSLSNCTDGVALVWHSEGFLTITELDGLELVRFIPLVASLAGGSEEAVETKLDQVFFSVDSNHMKQVGKSKSKKREKQEHASTGFRVVLYPETFEVDEDFSVTLRSRVNTLENDLLQERKKGIGLLSVSPRDIHSLEKVSRAIRWVLLGRCIRAYPPELDVPRRLQSILASEQWLTASRDRAKAQIVLPSDRDDRNAVDMKVQEVKRSLQRQGKLFERDVQMIEKFEDDLDKTIGLLEKLMICPICGEYIGAAGFEARDKSNFLCNCPNCDTEWGTRVCKVCDTRYPFLLPKIPGSDAVREEGWVEQVVGCDVLAIPCCKPGSEEFICPNCGRCGGYRSGQANTCSRCDRVISQNKPDLHS